MKKLFKITLLSIIIAFCGLFPEKSHANTNEKTMYEELCDIRKFFCGAAGLGIAAGVIAIIGVLLFTGKFNMSVLLVTAVGLVIFISADLLVEALFNPPAGAGVVQSCRCS